MKKENVLSAALVLAIGGMLVTTTAYATNNLKKTRNGEAKDTEVQDEKDGQEIDDQTEVEDAKDTTDTDHVNSRDQNVDEQEDVPATAAEAVLTQAAAELIAVQATGETVTKTELDREDGVVVYSIETQTQDLTIDATTGVIVKQEVNDAEDGE